MKRKLFIILAALLLSCTLSYGQDCKKMYDEGVSYMNAGKYKDAINKFNSAMACDESLTQKCNSMIQKCRSALVAPTSTPSSSKDLTLSRSSLSFTNAGGQDVITVEGSEWYVKSGTTAWCHTSISDAKLTVTVTANGNTTSRTATLTIADNKSHSKTLAVSQSGAEEHLSAARTEFTMPAAGGTETIHVNSNAAWSVVSIPSWCKAEASDGNLNITVAPNGTAQRRSGSVTIASATKKLTVNVSQEENSLAQTSSKNSKANSHGFSDKNITFGVTAGFVMPSFKASSSGSHIGSAVNYAYGSDVEAPDYKSAGGFSVGGVMDMRLTGDLGLQVGLEFVNMNVKNTFSGSYTDNIPGTDNSYYTGTAYDEYTEKYSLNYIELPIMVSYMIPVGDMMAVHLSAGPYLGYGISGKMKLDGTTDWPSLTLYNSSGEAQGNYSSNVHRTGELPLFKKEGSMTDQYTTGEMPTDDYDYTFTDSPFSKLNYGIRLGAAFEYSGFVFGLTYDVPLANVANSGYWEGNRFQMSDYVGNAKMSDYKHKVGSFRIKVGYMFR